MRRRRSPLFAAAAAVMSLLVAAPPMSAGVDQVRLRLPLKAKLPLRGNERIGLAPMIIVQDAEKSRDKRLANVIGLHDGVVVDAVAGQQLANAAALGLGHGHQQVLGGGVLILHGPGDGLGLVEDVGQLAAHADLYRRACGPGHLAQCGLDALGQQRVVAADLVDYRRDDAVFLCQKRGQQMFRLDGRVIILLGEVLGFQQGLAAFLGQFVWAHVIIL